MTSYFPHFPADLLARAARIRLACFDVDGTLTDGRLFFDIHGQEIKAFHVLDGQGLVQLRKAGITVAFITARTSVIALNRARELGLEGFDGVTDKLACVDELCTRLGIDRSQVSFMGDDLPDLPVLRTVGLSVVPANAHPWVVAPAHFQTHARGGDGAARELCDLLLTAHGKVDALLQAGVH